MILAQDYGPLTNVVGTAGALMAAAVALIRLVRGRAKWEPAEEDVSSGFERVSAALTAVLVALMWWYFGDGSQASNLARVTAGAAIVLVTALIVYSLLIGTMIYEVKYTDDGRSVKRAKIIGGFWMTKAAREARRRDSMTVQETLASAEHNPDLVWPRIARALAKVCFTLSAVLLTLGASVALAGAAMLIG